MDSLETARHHLWLHEKTGGVYEVVAVTVDEHDASTLRVAYRPTGDDYLSRDFKATAWSRPYEEFKERFRPI